MKYRMYVGGYGNASIAAIDFEEGKFTFLGTTGVVNASYLCLAADGKTLYAVGETQQFRGVEGGSVMSFRIRDDGRLIQTSIVPTYGKDPCHLILIDGLLLVANYTSGSFSRYRLNDDGTIQETFGVIAHSALDGKKQSHVHQILPAGNDRIAVADLGLDKVFFYDRAQMSEPLPDSFSVNAPEGFGPRHMAFMPNKSVWHVLCELKGQVLTYRGTSESDRPIGRSAIGSAKPENAGAALRLSPDGKLMLATGRQNAMVDLYAVNDGDIPVRLSSTPTHGDWPRDAVFSPDGRYVLCANERSHCITAFRVNNGCLEYVGKVETHAPTCIVWA